MSTKNLSIEQAREIFNKLVENVNNNYEKYVISENGQARAILMSYEEYECWLETMEIYSESNGVAAKN